jgi:hypothetical protein
MQAKRDSLFPHVRTRPDERLDERLSSALRKSQRFPVIQTTSFGPFYFSGLTDQVYRGFDTEADLRDRIEAWVNEGGAEAEVRP